MWCHLVRRRSVYGLVVNVQVVTLFLALLAIVSGLLVFLALGSRLLGDSSGFLQIIEPLRLELIAAVAATATLGSLYLSEGVGFQPCRLCWAQRAFMYPLAVLLVGAVLDKRLGSARIAVSKWLSTFVGLLCLIGFGLAVFHRYEQSQGGVGSLCDPAVPCSARWLNHFGFMTIPTMAAIGFVTIAVFSVRAPGSSPADSGQNSS